MKRIVSLLFIFILVLLNPIVGNCTEVKEVISEEPAVTEYSPEIFFIDSDFSSDVDDAFAISTAVWFEDAGLVDLRGVSLCITSTRGAQAMTALLYAHKVWDVPVSMDTSYGIPIYNKYYTNMINGRPSSQEYFNNTTKFYRKMLSESEKPVNIVTLGQFINMSALLNSQPDEYSPLTGYELIQQKVKALYVVGCKNSGKPENNIWYSGVTDVPNRWFGTTGVPDSAINVANNWPTKLVFVTSETGGTFSVGGFLARSDWRKTDILNVALIDFGAPNGHTAFDPMAIYVAMCDANGLLDSKGIVLEPGRMRIYQDGSSTFTAGEPTHNHYRVVKSLPDSVYQSEINSMLAFEYEKRSGKKVQW